MFFKEKTISTKNIYKGKIIDVKIDTVLLPNGKKSTREIVKHTGAVAVIPILDNGKLVMVKQFRKPIEKINLEIPAGKLEPNEKPLECAKRELSEETGYISDKLKYILSFYTTPGFSDEIIHLFLAQDLKKHQSSHDEDEFLEIVEVPFKTVLDMIYKGEIRDGKTILGVLITEKLLKERT
ncbi:MAG: ADP-ribose pyrophosphatase [Thermosediminibacterales bacterium]|nr:ADP-ribose pyrophosphatase [Thermosediminibacterales bacterium]